MTNVTDDGHTKPGLCSSEIFGNDRFSPRLPFGKRQELKDLAIRLQNILQTGVDMVSERG
jgi:hypothetical protein